MADHCPDEWAIPIETRVKGKNYANSTVSIAVASGLIPSIYGSLFARYQMTFCSDIELSNFLSPMRSRMYLIPP